MYKEESLKKIIIVGVFLFFSGFVIGNTIGLLITIVGTICIYAWIPFSIYWNYKGNSAIPNKVIKQEHKKGSIYPLQNRAKKAIVEYWNYNKIIVPPSNDYHYVTSEEEYVRLQDYKDHVLKIYLQKDEYRQKLNVTIRDLFGSFPEGKTWFKINILGKEFGILLQQYIRNIDENSHTLYINAVYILPWSSDLDYNINDSSFLFYKLEEGRTIYNYNKDKLDEFIIKNFDGYLKDKEE